MLEDSFQKMQARDLVVIVSGDGDLVPPVKSLQKRGFKARNMFWKHGSTELREAADDFYPPDSFFEQLTC